MKKRVLVISPHPDDESLGCGGTIRKHVTEGDRAEIVFLTSGEKGGHGRSLEETARVREKEARRAASILGVSKVEFWREPDSGFRVTETNLKRLQTRLREYRPDFLYVTHEKEAHPEHRAAARLVADAFSGNSLRHLKTQVWMFEVWTPLQQLDLLVDISPYVAVKRRAIRAHASQCAVMDFDVALLALNRYRGEMHSWPGGDYAEAFQRLKR